MSNSTSKPVFVNTVMTTAVRDAVNKVEGAKRAMSKFADTALAEFGPDAVLHFTSPKTKGSLATPESWEAFNAVLVTTFTAAQQKLLELPVKSLSDAEKKRRKYLQQQLGSKAKDLRNGLKRRLGETEPKAPKAPRAPETRIRDAAQDIIKVCENIESPTFRPAEIKALAEQIIRSI
jgi:hypothetical protein